MGAGHSHALYVHEHSLIHRLPSETKLVAVAAFVVTVALTPREAIPAFAGYAILIGSVAGLARIPLKFMAARLIAILPFVLFAFLLPFVAGGEQVELLGVTVSEAGLWGAWNILAKASIGASATILLAATTEVPDMLNGMGRLHVPSVLTAIAGFMMRYLEVIAEELGRMRTAMTARGFDPRWIWQVRPIASSSGALFIRSYERGERVHSAMLARGFTGEMPTMTDQQATTRQWIVALSLPTAGIVVAVVGLVIS